MDARECLLTRRSVRKYRTDPIPREVLERIMEAAVAAPSAINFQHWYFVVVESPERVEEIRQIMERVTDKFRPDLKKRFANHPETVTQTENFLNTLGHAPVCILAYFLKDSYPDRDGAMQSVSAAIENLLLAAWAEGLGSCWLSAPQKLGFGPELQARFAPDKGEFVAAITLGYSDESPNMPVRREGRYTFI